MKNYIKYNNGIRVDMMGNYHGGVRNLAAKTLQVFQQKKELVITVK